jgi:hypothetical protein
MKWVHALVLTAAVVAAVFVFVPVAGAGEGAGPVTVGVYDSRMVALAYGRSEEFMGRINKMRSELEAAKARGDEETVARLEAEGPALQDQLHKQVFGNAPIPEIMERIKDSLPAIAEEAGVDIIVCKWDIAWQGDGFEFVDVSMPMVRLFDPTPETLGMAEKMRDVDPVPAEQLETHNH